MKTTKEVARTKEKGYWSALNFLLTDWHERKLYAFRDVNVEEGKDPDVFPLFYTVPGHDKDNKSVVFSSEPLTKDDDWTSLDLGDLFIADKNANIEEVTLRV